jgi:hypothetical protein
MQLLSLIDTVDKLHSCEEKFVEDTLTSVFSMADRQIQIFKQMLYHNNEKIQRFKMGLLGKVLKSRVQDFSYNFNIRYAEKSSDKVDFGIRILIKFINDQGKQDKIDMELTINQFYSIFNEFQKIETMIKTLAN